MQDQNNQKTSFEMLNKSNKKKCQNQKIVYENNAILTYY